jgi:hypothetical protein
MWVKFSERHPKKGQFVITRHPGKPGDAFEDHRMWNPNYLNVLPPVTHWWDGEECFDFAIKLFLDEKYGPSTTSSTT